MKKWLSLLLCLVLLTGMTVSTGTAEGTIGTEEIQTGLVEENGAWYFYDENGNKLYGWQTIEGSRYYFGGYDGRAATGMQIAPDGTGEYRNYFFDSDGKMLTGWISQGTDRYYYGEDGARLEGLVQIDGATYYLGPAMATGLNYIYNKETGVINYYYFGSDGKMQTGWISDDTGRYYYGEDGARKTGWLQVDGATYYLNPAPVTGMHTLLDPKTNETGEYYFSSDGKMQTGWVSDDTGRYYYGPDGRRQSGMVRIDGDTYYLRPAMVTGPWNVYDAEKGTSDYYYFDSDGKMQTGWITVEEQDYQGNTVERKYYYGDDGKRQSGWQDIDGEKYYLNNNAAIGLVSVWNKEDSTSEWYYFDEEGRMQTGLISVEGETYYFGSDGKAISGWKEVDSVYYHFSEYYRHSADKGLVRIDGASYFFDEDGKMQTGWTDVGDQKGWRLFGDNGAMVESFAGWNSVTIPAKVTKLVGSTFSGMGRNCVIYCEPGSYAEAFAKQSGLQYDNGQKRVVGYDITNVNDKAKWVVANYTDNSMSNLEKVRVLHDWLIHNAHYDYTYSSYSANGVLVNGSGVCQSYAEAFLLLAQTAGIECVLVSGTADNGSGNGPQGHAWNMVKLGDHWYHLDATWDDPTWASEDKSTLPAVSGIEDYDYFLISDEEISRNHYWYSNRKALVSIAYEGTPGWQTVAGEWVYYDENGYLATGPTEIDGKLYGLGEDGRLMTAGWHTVKGLYCYADDSGILVADDWVADGGDWYYMDENGYLKTGWIEVDGSWYYLAEDGRMQTGWVLSGGTWYLLTGSGAMATGWAADGGDWYYFNESGMMQTGWIEDNGTWYYLGNNGIMQKGWVLSGNSWYLMTDSGAMATGWVQAGGKWYYMGSSGAMATGWVQDGGAWYFLGADGAMFAGTRANIGGTEYVFDANGAWVQ